MILKVSYALLLYACFMEPIVQIDNKLATSQSTGKLRGNMSSGF